MQELKPFSEENVNYYHKLITQLFTFKEFGLQLTSNTYTYDEKIHFREFKGDLLNLVNSAKGPFFQLLCQSLTWTDLKAYLAQEMTEKIISGEFKLPGLETVVPQYLFKKMQVDEIVQLAKIIQLSPIKSADDVLSIKEDNSGLIFLLQNLLAPCQEQLIDLGKQIFARCNSDNMIQVYLQFLLENGRPDIASVIVYAAMKKMNVYLFEQDSIENKINCIREIHFGQDSETIILFKRDQGPITRLVPQVNNEIEKIWNEIRVRIFKFEDLDPAKKIIVDSLQSLEPEQKDYFFNGELPDEIVIRILKYLLPKGEKAIEKNAYSDICHFRQVNKKMKALSADRLIWSDQFEEYVLAHGYLFNLNKNMVSDVDREKYFNIESPHSLFKKPPKLLDKVKTLEINNDNAFFPLQAATLSLAEMKIDRNGKHKSIIFNYAVKALKKGNRSGWFVLYYLSRHHSYKPFLSKISLQEFQELPACKTQKFDVNTYDSFLNKRCVETLLEDRADLKDDVEEVIEKYLVSSLEFFIFKNTFVYRKRFLELIQKKDCLTLSTDSFNRLMEMENPFLIIDPLKMNFVNSMLASRLGYEFVIHYANKTGEEKKVLFKRWSPVINNLKTLSPFFNYDQLDKVLSSAMGKTLLDTFTLDQWKSLLFKDDDMKLLNLLCRTKKELFTLFPGDTFLSILNTTFFNDTNLRSQSIIKYHLFLMSCGKAPLEWLASFPMILSKLKPLDFCQLMLNNQLVSILKTHSLIGWLAYISLDRLRHLLDREMGLLLTYPNLVRTISDQELHFLEENPQLLEPNFLRNLNEYANSRIKATPGVEGFMMEYIQKLIILKKNDLLYSFFERKPDLIDQISLEILNQTFTQENFTNQVDIMLALYPEKIEAFENSRWLMLINNPNLVRQLSIDQMCQISEAILNLFGTHPGVFDKWTGTDICNFLCYSTIYSHFLQLEMLPSFVKYTSSLEELTLLLSSDLLIYLASCPYWQIFNEKFSFSNILNFSEHKLPYPFTIFSVATQEEQLNIQFVKALYFTGCQKFWQNVLETFSTLEEIYQQISQYPLRKYIETPSDKVALVFNYFSMREIANLDEQLLSKDKRSTLDVLFRIEMKHLQVIFQTFSFDELMAIVDKYGNDFFDCLQKIEGIDWKAQKNHIQEMLDIFRRSDEISSAKRFFQSKFAVNLVNKLLLSAEFPLAILRQIDKSDLLSVLINAPHLANFIVDSKQAIVALRFQKIKFSSSSQTVLQWLLKTKSIELFIALLRIKAKVFKNEDFMKILKKADNDSLNLLKGFEPELIEDLFKESVTFGSEEWSYLRVLLLPGTSDKLKQMIKNRYLGISLKEQNCVFVADKKNIVEVLMTVYQNKEGHSSEKRKNSPFFASSASKQQKTEETKKNSIACVEEDNAAMKFY